MSDKSFHFISLTLTIHNNYKIGSGNDLNEQGNKSPAE